MTKYILTEDEIRGQFISFLRSIQPCIDRKEKATIVLFFALPLSVPVSHFYVIFEERIVTLTTCKFFKITRNVFGRIIIPEYFTAVAVHMFVLEAPTPSNKASKSSPATVVNRLSAIFNGSGHLWHVRLVHYFFKINKNSCCKSISLFYRMSCDGK